MDVARAQVGRWRDDLREARDMPVITVNLMYKRAADNHVFFRDLTREWYDEVTAPHPKFRIIHNLEWGVAVCTLPRSHDEYFMHIEASARRNVKKARRKGYRCMPFVVTEDHLDDIRAIHQSTDVRQGKVSDEILYGEVRASTDPPSRSPYHAYPYIGVFLDDRLVAYSSCFIAGELASVERLFGHADHQSAGVVPKMLNGMAKVIYDHHPAVRYFAYGSYFGAAPNMRRFKKKFRFFPHRVHWKLDTRETAD